MLLYQGCSQPNELVSSSLVYGTDDEMEMFVEKSGQTYGQLDLKIDLYSTPSDCTKSATIDTAELNCKPVLKTSTDARSNGHVSQVRFNNER